MRLDIFLAEATDQTRKTIRTYIKEGKVTVNYNVMMKPATDIDENTDVIECLGELVLHPGKKYYMFHKPGGCVTATKDVSSKTVLDYFDTDIRSRLFPVGRLDKDTEGLLLLTNDGQFAHSLMHPDKHVEKTYFFWAFGSLEAKAREQLKSGIMFGEGEDLAKAEAIEVEEEGTYQELQDKMNLENRRDIRINPYHQPVVCGYITITEGRKHQVKRMLKAVGCYIIYLKRISIGGLLLDEALEKGQYRELTNEELRTLKRLPATIF